MKIDKIINKNLFETPFAGIVVTDPKGQVIRYNSKMSAITGYSAEDLQGEPVDTYFHPDSLNDFCISCDSMKEQKRQLTGIYVRFLHKSGRYIDTVISIYTMEEEDELQGYVIYLEPLTGMAVDGSSSYVNDDAKWLTEGHKDPKEEFLCNIFHGVQESIIILDKDFKIVSFNMKLVELLEVDFDYLQNSVSFTDISADDMNHSVALKFIKETFEGEEQSFTWQLKKHRNGETIDVEVYMTRVSKMGEDVVLTTIRDITDKKQMEDILRNSEQRYRQLVEHSPDGIVIHKSGIIKYVNPSGAKILGGEIEEDILGREVMEFFAADKKDIIAERLKTLYVDREPIPLLESEMVRIDGKKIFVDFAAMPFDLDGNTAVQVVLRDITEKKKQDEYIRYLALHDKLTGLPNRELLADRVYKAAKRRKRDEQKNAVIFFDLDGFKPINDTLGHDAGDKALKEIAVRVEGAIRGSDTAARMGGDEFVVLLEGIKDFEEITMVAERIHKSINKPIEIGGEEFHVGASMGIAVYPDDSTAHSKLLSMADKAMYHVKATGKNRFEFYSAVPKDK